MKNLWAHNHQLYSWPLPARSPRAHRTNILASIRILPTIRHAQNARSCVLQCRRDLILELPARIAGRRVDGGATAASTRWVTGLQHEGGDDTVKQDVGVVAALGEGGEILACLGGRKLC